MAKQKCENCQREFTRMEVIKTAHRGFSRITCPQCGTKHTILEHFKVIIPIILIFPIIPLYLLVTPILGLTPNQMLICGTILVLIGIVILPFIVKFGLPENLDHPDHPKNL